MYEIQHFTLCDGWINTSTDENGDPVTYDNNDAACTELADFLAEAAKDYRLGNLGTLYTADEFRIVFCAL